MTKLYLTRMGQALSVQGPKNDRGLDAALSHRSPHIASFRYRAHYVPVGGIDFRPNRSSMDVVAVLGRMGGRGR